MSPEEIARAFPLNILREALAFKEAQEAIKGDSGRDNEIKDITNEEIK